MRGGASKGWLWLPAAALALLLAFAAPVSAETVAVQPDGKILVAGSTPLYSGYVARLLPDGSLDSGFGTDGIVVDHGSGAVKAIALQSGGILALSDWGRIARYGTDGRLDTSFGTDGRASVGGVNHSSELIVLPDGRIAVGGTDVLKFLNEATVATLSADGRSREWISGAGAGTSLRALSPRADGSLVAAIGFGNGWGEGGLVRFVPGVGDYGADFGSVVQVPDARPGYDKSFGAGGGLVRVELPGDPPRRLWAGPLVARGDGVVVGSGIGGRLAVAGLDESGLPDGAFGRGGVATARVGAGVMDISDVETMDGKILVLGEVRPRLNRDACRFCATPLMARFLPGGQIDASFDRDGIVRLPGIFEPRHWSRPPELVPLPGGRVLIARVASEVSAKVLLARFGAGGSLDRGFGSSGVEVFEPCVGSERAQRRTGCLPSGRAEILQLRETPGGVALRLEASPVEEWGGVDSLRIRVPDSLRINEKQMRRARFVYRGFRNRVRRVVPQLHGRVLALHHLGSEGLDRVTLSVPGGVLRQTEGFEPDRRLAFRVRIGFVAGYGNAGTQTFVLRQVPSPTG